MASGRIRGIQIELTADTKGLYKGLQEARTAANQVQKALKDVNNLLKLKPTSTELLTQKQKLLGERVTEVKSRLEEEKKLLEEMQNSADSDKTVAQQEALKRQIEATEVELQKAQKEFREFGSVGLQQAAAVGEKMKEVGESISNFGKTWTQKVSAPIAAALGAAAKGAMDFEDSMAKVHTLSDDAAVSFSDLSAGVMQLSNETGRSGTELAEAMYQALSASVDTADALDFVSQAAKLAKAGFLETAGSVDVLTTILNAYQKDASETAYISDLLIQTQNDGKTTVNELAQQMGQVIPTAAAYNVSLENLTTAYALMTKNGINTANSTTYLNGMLTELAREGSEVSKILGEKTGKTFGQLQAEGKSLGDVLQILYDSVDGNAEQFANLWGNVRAGRGALTLAQQGAEGFNEELGKMYKASGNVDSALEKLDTPASKLKKALNELKNTGLELGGVFVEMVTPAIEELRSAAKKLSKWWGSLGKDTQKFIVKIALLAAAVGPVLVAVGKLTSTFGSLLTSLPKIGGAFSSVFGIIAAHPFVALGVAAATAIGGIALAFYNAREQMGPATQAALEFKEANDEIIATTIAQNDRMDVLRQRIQELNEEEELNTVQKQMMAQYVSELNGLLGEEAVHIDEATGKTIESTEAIYENIQARQQAALAAAYEAQIAEAAKRAAEAQIALMDAQTGLEINSRELEDAQAALSQKTQEAIADYNAMTPAQQAVANLDRMIADATRDEQAAVNDLMAERRELTAAVNDNTTAYDLNVQEMTRLDNASKTSQGVLDDLLKKIGKTSSDLSPTLLKGLQEGRYKLPTTVQELSALINFDKKVGELGLQGSEMVNSLQRSMRNGTSTISSASGELSKAATSGLGKASGEAQSIGGNISRGLSRGMESEAWRVRNTASSIAATAAKAMRIAAQVQSPSKLTIYIGAMMDAGLGKGMEDNIRKYITPAVNEVMDAASFGNIGVTAPNATSGMRQSAIPTLDLAGIYQAVRDGASAATIKNFIDGRALTGTVNTYNTNTLNGALKAKGAY